MRPKEERVTVITEKTKNTLIDCLESLLDDYDIDENYRDDGGCSGGYSTYKLHIDMDEEDPEDMLENLQRILKLCKGDIFETREENINVLLTQKI